MSTESLAYIYQLQNASFSSLSQTDFKIAVVDMDDAELSSSNLDQLQDSGKTLFSYVSIGEAEDYRDYWADNNWDNNKPDFLLAENKDWEGNFRVKFWDADWQQIMLDRVAEVAKLGYNGMYLDIVDAYQVSQVKNAYDGDDIRQEMEDFVIALSNHVKDINPDFQVITQNAVELMADADNEEMANTPFLNAIDGLGVEDLFYDDNTTADWSKWDLELIKFAQDAGKFVLATSYPTKGAKQADFITSALAEGLIPFVGNRDLDGTVDSDNYDILNQLPEGWLNLISGEEGGSSGSDSDSGEDDITPEPEDISEPEPEPEDDGEVEPEEGMEPIPEPTPEPEDSVGMDVSGTNRGDVINGKDGDDYIEGLNGHDSLDGGDGSDYLDGGKGKDTLDGGDGDDILIGGKGKDVLDGGDGSDYLDGGKSKDMLMGGEGSDALFGGKGHDTLDGGKGDDVLTGGGGKDKFVFNEGDGIDVVTDFTNPGKKGGDIIKISSEIFSSKDEILENITYSGGDAILDFGNGDMVVLSGVDGGLTSHDFSIF